MFARLISSGTKGNIIPSSYCKYGPEPFSGPCIYVGEFPGGNCGTGLDPVGGCGQGAYPF